MLTGEQIRAARSLIRWDQMDLVRASGVSEQTVVRLESFDGEVDARTGTVRKIKTAFETAGVLFISENGGGSGVRLKNPVKPAGRKTPSK